MKTKKYLFMTFIACIFLWIYTLSIIQIYEKRNIITEVHETGGNYMFINPLLECNATYNYYNPWKIKDTIDTYIRENIESWNIIDAAYYVRLLKNGSNFWYNEDIKFIPASLVKLPLAISLMRQLSFDELSTIILVSEVPTDTYSWDLVPDKVQVW